MPEATPDILTELYRVYPEAFILGDANTAHMVVEGHRVLSRQTIPGVDISTETMNDTLLAHITVAEQARIVNPIHSCIGITTPRGRQHIKIHLDIKRGASAQVLAHCLFPFAELARHVMEAHVEIGEGAELRYSEGHFHGPSGGVEVVPHTTVRVGPRGRYLSDFSLTTGRVGTLRIDTRVETAERAVAEINARVFGHLNDDIKIKDELVLAGKASRGLIKTRVAVEDDATSEVVGITHGNAEGARGHMDCTELVRDRAVAQAHPIVKVTHPLAKVTHEAAVGTVDQKQLETLMAHGLTPEQAVDVIIMGILR